jgi:hypothetical protein
LPSLPVPNLPVIDAFPRERLTQLREAFPRERFAARGNASARERRGSR